MRKPGPIAEMFHELVAAGHVTPVENMEDLRFPGELTHVPSYISYGTPEVPSAGRVFDAKLGYGPQRDRNRANHE